ncbi:hypothetical protein cypCar_00031718, partial [Cyprinus carpio]
CISSPCLHDGTCIVDSSHSFHCACLAGYTGKRCEHVPDQNCGIPPKPEHGDHFLVYGPNDVIIAIQYFCYKLYKLNGIPQRTCLGNNTWSGTAPTCVKELDKIPAADTEQNQGKHRPTGQDELALAKNKTSQEKENESKTVKDIKPQKPTPGKDNVGQDGKFGEDMGIDFGRDFVKEKPKAENKDADSSINTIRKKETGEDKDALKPFDKDAHLDIGKKVGSPTKDLGMEYIDIVLIDNRMANNQTTKADKTKDGGMDKGQKRIDGPQYTILSLTEDEKDNILYEIDTIHKGNNTKFFNRNDIENLGTLFEETEQLPSATIGNYNTTVMPTVSKTTDKMTMMAKPMEKVKVDTVNVKTSEQDLQQETKNESQQNTDMEACREPKVSVLVKQRVLHPHIPSRKTPVHKFYSSSGVTNFLREVQPTQAPFTMPPLPQGFHHVYTHIEYECMSPYYQHFGSARRTCLKMGKWSGRHVSCSPVCGKLTNFDPQNPSETNWPWLAAIYRLPVASKLGKLSVAKTMGANTELMEEESDMDGWQLVCSGALVNQRSVIVAAHCVTELGKLYPLDTAKIRVVLGKQYRSDLRVTKGLQRLRVSSITLHPNYDPLVLDSDVAILKLLDKARIGEHVLPICLPDAHDRVEDSRQRMVTGWSLLPDQKAGDAEKARVGRVILGDVVQCEQQYASYGVPISVSENMLCGQQGSGAEQSNICPADTGGILILPPVSTDSRLTPPHGQGSQEWKLLGLVSFGYDSLNCNPELYTVYTHVANFVSFIEENMT